MKPIALQLTALAFGTTLLSSAPSASAAEFTPATLTISTADGISRDVTVRSPQDVRNAIKPCVGTSKCTDISVETCDRCYLSAEATPRGYLLQSRLGPPGPLYDLLDKRPARKKTKFFNLKDVTTIIIDYLGGTKTLPLIYRDTGQI